MKASVISWADTIPDGWATEPLRPLVTLGKGLAITKADLTDEGARVISYGQIHAKTNAGTHTDDSLFRRVPWELAEQSAKLKKGDVVFADTSEDVAGLGNAAYIDDDAGAYAGYHSIICRPNQARLYGKYLAYLATTDAWRSQIREYAMGVKVFSLTQSILKRTWVLLPPLPEQEAIVVALDERTERVTRAIDAITRQLDALADYRKSLIQEVVTRGLDPDAEMRPSGIDWIGDIPAHWQVTKLKGLVRHFESGTSVRAATYPADGDEPGVLSLSAVFQGRFNPNANKAVGEDERTRLSGRVRKGTLLVSRCNTSEWVGTPALVDKDCGNLYLPDKIWQIDCSSVLINRYVYYALSAPASRAYCWMMSVGASESMQNIASKDLLNISIAMPRDTKETLQVVRYLDAKTAAIDRIAAAKRAQLDNLRQQRQAIIYEYVTGKRRVV